MVSIQEASLVDKLNADVSGVAEAVGRSLVQVRDRRSGVGSGVIVHSDGLIITNAHVVGRGPLSITLPDGSSAQARLLALDKECDLAALAVDATGLTPVRLGDSRRLRAGEWVLALGHPLGVTGAATAGVVIGTESERPKSERPKSERIESPATGREWIAVGMALRPGNSGGPLVDVEGRMVGVNTMMTGPDVGMAVPVHVVKEFLRQELGTESVAGAASGQPGPAEQAGFI